MTGPATACSSAYGRRVDGANWTEIAVELAELGCALLPRLLTAADARELIKLYDRDEAFRASVTMGRHGFGKGEYRYLAAPLPTAVDALRRALYPHLLPIAQDWSTKLGRPTPWPDTLDEWLEECHRSGQTKPTPLILKYGPGDWNALHRDLYGDLVFPLQVVINLTEPGQDYTGGEFLLVEQRPRAQSRGASAALPHLHGLVFTTRDRPLRTQRGLVGRARATRCVDAALRSALHPRHPFPRRLLMTRPTRTYTLINADGRPYPSPTKGTIGGHKASKIFGSLDCPSALRAIARVVAMSASACSSPTRRRLPRPATGHAQSAGPTHIENGRTAGVRRAAWPFGPRTPPRSGCPGPAVRRTS